VSIRASCIAVLTALWLLAGCAGDPAGAGPGDTGHDSAGSGDVRPLAISAIPDQDPARLVEREEALAAYLSAELGVDVEYVPVTDYAASVSLFRAGDLDMVFYGGLTGVQARLQTPGATVLAQRDIDADFRSVFIANTGAGVEPVDAVADLAVLAGRRFTFGSESSTSGRLMPEHFLGEAGVDTSQDLVGQPGFSGSHDKTVDLVESGSYDAGALNAQVWEARKKAGTVDLDKVREVFTTPAYHDYHWVSGPEVDDRFGDGFTGDLRAALLALDGSTQAERELLEAYGAGAIVPTEVAHYDEIEQIARKLGLLS
jgi:phosphonate transport system substrate-binding protein